jgi:UDP-N-acetylmuramoyl-L-alanyl-D-glutamate--2,6-diaminopimelate ligase
MKKLLKKLIPELSPIRLGWHKSKAFVAAFIYGFPARNLTVIGITGTDGKTTTTGMAAHILHENGMAVAALSTAFFRS